MKRIALFLVALSAAPAAAQQQPAAAANPAVGAVAPLYAQVRDYLVAAAEAIPQADLAFKPTPEVRSMGQLIGHVANAQFLICSIALGEQNPATQNYEQVTDKAALIEGLRASNAVCDRAYAQSDADAAQMVRLFGQERSRLGALSLNAVHGWEHYGNLVTYMRLKGMVPPSSQGG